MKYKYFLFLLLLLIVSCSSTSFKINIKTQPDKVIVEHQLDQRGLGKLKNIIPGHLICYESFNKKDLFITAIYEFSVKLSPLIEEKNIELDIPLEFKVTYPGKLLKCNATSVKNNIATWYIKRENELNIYLKAYQIRWYIPIIIIAVILLFYITRHK